MDLDHASELKIAQLYPDLQVRIRRVYEDVFRLFSLRMRITEGMRSLNAQEILYAQGRTVPGKVVTNARPGYSFHHYGLAFDSCFIGDDPYLEKNPSKDFYWKEFGRLATSHGLAWGGYFKTIKDKPHCQMTYGLSIVECLDLYERGGIMAIYSQIDSLTDISSLN